MTLGSHLMKVKLFESDAYLDVVDEDLSESRGQHVFRGLCRTVTNVGHQVHALEATTHSVVNTFGLAPVTTQLVVPIALVTSELLCPLLYNLRP